MSHFEKVISISNNEDDNLILSCNEEVKSFVQEDVKVIQEKIKDVPENERIKLNDDTIFRFSCTENNGYLKLKLTEIGAFAPYIYECILTLSEIKKKYRMFRSCSDLEAVKTHILRLFNNKKIKLIQEKEDSIKFILTVYNISEELDIEIEANRIMTTEKDDALLKLYEIQKKELKLLKEIENYMRKLGQKGNNFIEELNKIKKKY